MDPRSVSILVCEHQSFTSFIKSRVVRNRHIDRQTDIGKKKKIEKFVVDNDFINMN